MKRALPILLDTLHTLALSVWLGGIVALGIASLPPANLALALTRLGGGIEIGGLVMVAAQFLLRRRYQRNRSLFVGDGARQLVTFSALMLAEMCRYNIFPIMESAAAEGKLEDFTRLHRLYVAFAIGQGVLLVAVAALSAWLQLPRATVSPAPSETPLPASSSPSQEAKK